MPSPGVHVTPEQPDKPHQRTFGREAVFTTVVTGNYSDDPRTVCVFKNVGITVAKQGNASVPVYPADAVQHDTRFIGLCYDYRTPADAFSFGGSQQGIVVVAEEGKHAISSDTDAN